MAVLLLIRHGENDYSKRGRFAGRLSGVHLNEHGRGQAGDLAAALGQIPMKAVYSSPLERAIETAEPIARARHLKVQLEPGLLESDIGRWQGKSVRRLALTRYWRVVQQAPSRAVHPGGESFLQTQTRTVTALERICAHFGPRDVVACVFHADPIKLAVAHYIGLSLDRFQRLSCDTGSVTMLVLGSTGAQLVWLNRQPPFEVSLSHPGP
jgi:probable phosphoglycerate mutase